MQPLFVDRTGFNVMQVATKGIIGGSLGRDRIKVTKETHVETLKVLFSFINGQCYFKLKRKWKNRFHSCDFKC